MTTPSAGAVAEGTALRIGTLAAVAALLLAAAASGALLVLPLGTGVSGA